MIPLLFLACTTPTPPDSTDTAGNTDSATDSGDTAAEADPVTANYVVISYTVADRGEGFDVDNDGEVDNAIWPVGSVLDPQVADAIAVAQHVVIQQVNGIDDWTDDDDVSVGVLTAEDPDGDGTNNASGTEVYAGGIQVDTGGNILVSTPTSLVGGAFSTSVATGPLTVGAYVLELATGLFVDANINETSETGLLGFGISLEKLEVALTAEGVSEDVLNVLEGLADLDLEGDDGVNDAISMAFHFEAAACGVTGG